MRMPTFLPTATIPRMRTYFYFSRKASSIDAGAVRAAQASPASRNRGFGLLERSFHKSRTRLSCAGTGAAPFVAPLALATPGIGGDDGLQSTRLLPGRRPD